VQRATFGDGLPVGSYYFKEIGVDNDAVHGNGGNVIFRFTLERNTEQVPYPGNPPSGTTWPMAVVVTAQADATNPPFKASFTATKYDDSSLLHPGIKGVEFTLEKVCPTTPTTASVLCKKAPAGTETKVQVGSDGNAFVSAKKIVSGVGGKVSFAITEKGTYVFTEKSNTGYDPSRFITLEFTIEEGDYNAGSAVDLSAIASRSSSVVSQGSITSEGIPNVRITPGSLPLTGEHSGLIWLSAIGGAGLLALLAWAGTSLSRRRRDS
jgi:LPXTG-motif cell wall-anchored protein